MVIIFFKYCIQINVQRVFYLFFYFGCYFNFRFDELSITAHNTEESSHERESWEVYDCNSQYFDSDDIKQMIEFTNMRYIWETGKALNLSLNDLNIFIGATLLMACLQYPRIKM